MDQNLRFAPPFSFHFEPPNHFWLSLGSICIFAYCGLVVEIQIHLTAQNFGFFAPFPTSTKHSPGLRSWGAPSPRRPAAPSPRWGGTPWRRCAPRRGRGAVGRGAQETRELHGSPFFSLFFLKFFLGFHFSFFPFSSSVFSFWVFFIFFPPWPRICTQNSQGRFVWGKRKWLVWVGVAAKDLWSNISGPISSECNYKRPLFRESGSACARLGSLRDLGRFG